MEMITPPSKEQILAVLRRGIDTGTITRNDIIAFVQSGNVRQDATADSSDLAAGTALSTTQLLQYLGGFVVLIGIGTFIGTFWDDIGSAVHVLIGLGGALCAYILGTVLMRVDTHSQSGIAFHLIAGCLFPFGTYVTLHEMFGTDITAGVTSAISLILLVLYALTYAARRHVLFTFFMLSASISFLYSGIYALMPDIPYEFMAHLTFLIGAAGIAIGYSFRDTENAPLSEFMYGLGGLAVLIAPASVFGSVPAWQFLYAFLLGGMFALALFLRSKRILTLSTLALMGYVMYLTGKYFADVVGWPIALIAAGIMLIVIGYLGVRSGSKM
jgi:hypothetical protein